jgi:hypothetical protein
MEREAGDYRLEAVGAVLPHPLLVWTETVRAGFAVSIVNDGASL